MRSTLALIAGTAVIAALGYHFVFAEQRPKPRHVLAVQNEDTSAARPKTGMLETLLREQRVSADVQRHDELSGKLAALDARLNDLEASRAKVPDGEAAADTPPASADKVSEAVLATWADESLQREQWDKEWTSQATAEIEKGLAHLPAVKLEGVDCNKRICRAEFAQDDGTPPAASDLVGVLPFANEGFTIGEPDGRVKVYFTRAGDTVKDLRNEAFAALQ